MTKQWKLVIAFVAIAILTSTVGFLLLNIGVLATSIIDGVCLLGFLGYLDDALHPTSNPK